MREEDNVILASYCNNFGRLKNITMARASASTIVKRRR